MSNMFQRGFAWWEEEPIMIEGEIQRGTGLPKFDVEDKRQFLLNICTKNVWSCTLEND